MFNIVIPSHNRVKLIEKYAINFIIKHDLHKKVNIYIFVTPGQLEDYNILLDKYNFLTILEGDYGLINQRNYIRNYFNNKDKLLYIDDDLKDILFLDNYNINCMYDNLYNMFNTMINNNCCLASVAPSNNKYFCTDKILKGLYFCTGCCYLEINNKHPQLYLNNNFNSECEDFINTFNHYQFNGFVYRFNYACVNHKYSSSKGGMFCNDDTRRLNRIDVANMLTNVYSMYFKLYKKPITKYNTLECIEPRFKNIKFKSLYIKKKVDCKGGLYYSCDKDYLKLDSKTNYYIYDDNNKLLAIVLRNLLRVDKWNEDLYKKFNIWSRAKNTNRADIAGVLDLDKMAKADRKYILNNNIDLDKIKKNSNNTRICDRNYFKMDITNIYTSITLGYYNGKKLSQYDNKIDKLKLDTHLYNILEPLENIYINHYCKLLNINLNKSYRNTLFNAITINKASRSACHKDSKNTSNYALLFHVDCPYEDNKFSGGDLLFPEYKLAFNMKPDKDIIIFDSKNIYHCNSYLNDINNNSRLSFVLFSKFKL